MKRFVQHVARVLAGLSFCLAPAASSDAASPDTLFREGTEAYHAGEFGKAADAFGKAAIFEAGSGTLQNLGNAEWQQHHVGTAILAWERALWVDPLSQFSRANLRFARKSALIEAPQLAWYEAVSAWLPADWWGWIAAGSLWLAVGIALVPGILRRPRAAWHQAVAALAVTALFLSLPALAGIRSRAQIGFVVVKETPLLLTPTEDGQLMARLSPGEPGRVLRQRGKYSLVRTPRAVGWIEQTQFESICGTP